MTLDYSKETFDKIDKKQIAVIDFDGTIVEHCFPDIGDILPEAFEVMQELKDAGWILILWTCRENDFDANNMFLQDAVDFCNDHGVEFDGINETPLEYEFRHGDTLKRKAYGNVYIDDRNLGGFPGWAVVRELLL